jgi:hypothetical protein
MVCFNYWLIIMDIILCYYCLRMVKRVDNYHSCMYSMKPVTWSGPIWLCCGLSDYLSLPFSLALVYPLLPNHNRCLTPYLCPLHLIYHNGWRLAL